MVFVRDPQNNFVVVIGSTSVTAGDMLFSSSGLWELADADDNTKFAEAIAIGDYASGEISTLCTSCIIVDTTAPYTQGDQYFLSTTAGAVTATRPTGANALVQVVGFGLSGTELKADVPIVREQSFFIPASWGAATSADTLQNTYMVAKSVAADSDSVGGALAIPHNVVGLEAAFFWMNVEDTLMSGGYTFGTFAGVDDQAHSAHSDTISEVAISPTTAFDYVRDTVTAGFDAAGLIDAGNVVTWGAIKQSETGGDDWQTFGVELILLVV